MSTKQISVRLPEHIKPIRYELTLKPDLDAFVFEGWETINLEVGKATKNVTLHSKNLNIEKAEWVKGEAEVWAAKITYQEKNDTATLVFPKSLPKGKSKIRLVFRGVLNDKLHGFYRSKYAHNGRENYLATTQFEATDARRAFPCFDEPAHKAVFEINIIHPSHLTALSNTTPIDIKEHSPGYKIVKFEPTPKMSTYLVAFMVGEFEYLESKTKARKNPIGKSRFKSVRVRVYTTPGKKHQASFALQTAVRALEFFENYFDIEYPLPVMDLIALPDFAAGAMENWGAITYRETALLLDVENSSTLNKEWVAIVIVHELAHQWFGNLVTMEWWTHLWLNEGFASYMEHLGTASLFPKWDMWTQFCDSRLNQALELDGLKSTHPIEVNVNNPSEIGEIFDSISYAKGASIIRMLAEYIGEKNFREGLRRYLKEFAYSNASTEHLWQTLEQVSGKAVGKIMSNWTSKPGYPVISLSLEGQGRLIVSQSRFYSSMLEKNNSADKTLWNVPLTYVSKNGKGSMILGKKETITKIPLKSWVKFNANETGVYRTLYPSHMLEDLFVPITQKVLGPEDRLGVIRDVFALAESGDLETSQALKALTAYKKEDNYSVWTEIVGNLYSIDNLLFNTAAQEKFRKLAISLLKPIASKLGWRAKINESHSFTLMRSVIFSALGRLGEKQVVNYAVATMHKIKLKKNNLSPDLRSVIYYTSAAWGGKAEYNKLMALYQTAPTQEEKDRIARSLAYVKSPNLVKQFLRFALSNKVRNQDAPFLLASAIRNPYSRQQAWRFIESNWTELTKRFGFGGNLLNRIIQSLGSVTSHNEAKNIEAFFKRNPAPGAAMTLRQVLEKAHSQASWKEREYSAIDQWLKQSVKKD